MSLVAYLVDSDEESENSEEETGIDAIIVPKKPENLDEVKAPVGLVFDHLPAPKTQIKRAILEEDDEFLHKSAKNGTTKVQIKIPSLNEFKDVQTYKNENRDDSTPLRRSAEAPKKTSKLLNILPQAKSEMNFMKTNVTQKEMKKENTNVTSPMTTTTIPSAKPVPIVKSANRSLIPDSIRLGRKGCNTEDQIDRVHNVPKAVVKHKLSDSEEEEEEETAAGDFFSLNDDKNMPEVSQITLNEVNALVQSRVTKMSARVEDLKAEDAIVSVEQMDTTAQNISELDEQALEILAGRKAAKRARRGQEDLQIMDIHSSEVLPSRDEWMRSALAASTEYQPKGVLNDEEPAAGTRRKHQITYLAHKAKANEAELQAMWAANRQTRRATQSKYGF